MSTILTSKKYFSQTYNTGSKSQYNIKFYNLIERFGKANKILEIVEFGKMWVVPHVKPRSNKEISCKLKFEVSKIKLE